MFNRFYSDIFSTHDYFSFSYVYFNIIIVKNCLRYIQRLP